MDVVVRDGTVVQSFAGADEGYRVDAERFVLKSYLELPTGPDPDDPWVFDYVECGGGEPDAVAYAGSRASGELSDNSFGQNKVLELTTGEVTDIGSAGSAAAWDDDGRLDTLASAEETAFVVSPTGDVVAYWRQRGNVILGSRDGSTLLVYDIDAGSQDGAFSVVRAGTVHALTLPGRIDRRPRLAPDGSGFVVEPLIDGRRSLFYIAWASEQLLLTVLPTRA